MTGLQVAALSLACSQCPLHPASASAAPEGGRRSEELAEVQRSTAGMTSVGVDGRIAVGSSSPYGGSLRLVGRGTQYGHGTAWWSAGVDFGVGLAVARPGFAYDLGIRLGPGHWFGDHVAVAVYSGVGLEGVVASLPFAAQSPLGMAVQLNLLDGLTIALRGEGRWEYATRRTPTDGLLGLDGHMLILDVGVARRTASSDKNPEFNLSLGMHWQRIASSDFVGLHLGTSAATDPW